MLGLDLTWCETHWEARRPNPIRGTVYLLAAQTLGLNPEDLLFVGHRGDGELTGAQPSGLRAALVASASADTYDPERPEEVSGRGIVLEKLTKVSSWPD